MIIARLWFTAFYDQLCSKYSKVAFSTPNSLDGSDLMDVISKALVMSMELTVSAIL